MIEHKEYWTGAFGDAVFLRLYFSRFVSMCIYLLGFVVIAFIILPFRIGALVSV